jgi:molybdopterin converting factor small subunit
MSVEIYLTPSLQYIISDVKFITVEGKTVGECLDNVVEMYPQLSPLLLGSGHKLRNEYTLFINGENASPDDPDRPVRAGDKLNIVDIIIGG